MKKALLLLLSLVFLLSACGKEEAPQNRPWPETVEYSSLSDPDSRNLLSELLNQADIPEDRQQVLFSHVDQINGLLTPEEQTDGFQVLPIEESLYDPYELQDRWDQTFPDFVGYNCRITAFSLFENLAEIAPAKDAPDDFLFLDAEALNCDSTGLPDEADRDAFFSLFKTAPTENTRDPQVHLKHWQDHWDSQQVSFPSSKASLICVLFHDQIDSDQLSVGHAGLLLPGEDGKLYFLEKIAFQEPYRLCRFESRAALSDYLMVRYDVAYGQDTAAPMILENDHLIEGYRIRSQG